MDGGVGERRQWQIDRGRKEMETMVVGKGGREGGRRESYMWARVAGNPPKPG